MTTNGYLFDVLATQYSDHIDRLQSLYERALARQGQDCSAILLHSGSASYYYGDDRGIAFQAYGHFLHWLSVNQPDQFLLLRPGEKPTYYQIVP